MTFLAPLALALTALAVPVVLLYMLRLRRRDVPVSSTLLWAEVLRGQSANTPWQRLRRNWLLLQLLILAALILALARPSVTVPTLTAGRTALLLDASASMNATDVLPSRFERARALALALIDTLGVSDTMAVIRVSAGPQVLMPYTSDHDQLRAAVQAAQAGTTGADWGSALTLAAAGAAGAEKFGMVIVGDGGLPADVGAVPADVRFVPVGASAENVAIAALAVAAVPGSGPQLYARLINYGTLSADVILSLRLDGTLFSAQPYTIQPGTVVNVTVDTLPANFHTVTAQLSRPAASTVPDYLSEDDSAYAVYNAASAGRVLLMTAQNRFLEQGFASLPGWTTFRGQLASGLPADPYDLYVFDGWLPSALPNGPLLIVNPPPGSITPLFSVGNIIKTPVTAASAAADARVAAVKVSAIHVRQYESISAPWATALITASDGGPLLLVGDYNGQRVAIIPFDLHDSDLPLQIAWPILLADLGQWYHAPRLIDLAAVEGLSAGQTLLLHPAPAADSVQVRTPAGKLNTLPVDQAALVYADTDQPGLYTVTSSKTGTLLQSETFAVNLFDPLESSIAPRTTLPIGQLASSSTPAAPDVGQREYWPWIALLALIVLALEWYVYHRGQGLPRLNRRRIVRF